MIEGERRSSTLVERAKRILTEPKVEWDRIDAEPATVAGLFSGYVAILAAIPPVAQLIGSLAFGYRFFGIVWRPSVGGAIVTAVLGYALALVSVAVLGIIIDALAPTFGGTKNRVQATKVAAYSYTAAWVAGIFNIIPQLAMLAVLGSLYSLYLLYLGLPRLMKTPAEKAGGYVAAVIVAGIVLAICVAAVVGLITNAFVTRPLIPTADQGQISGTMSIPGVGSVDLGKLEQASERMEAASKQMQDGKALPAVAPTALQALLPESLGAYKRVEVSNSGASAAGMGGSTAQGRYENGDSSFELSVSDIQAAGALAAMGSALNVQANRQTATGYEKAGTVDGRMTTEKWDGQAKNGEFGVMVADRFMVQASGNVPSIDVLKGAVSAVGLAKLEALKG